MKTLPLALVATALVAIKSYAGDVTLTQAVLDSYGSRNTDTLVNFANATLGVAPNSIPNTLTPGGTVFLSAQTRTNLILVNLQGTATQPITVTNTGGQFIIDTVGTTAPAGIQLWGPQHVILKGTPSPGSFNYGIKVAETQQNSVGLNIDYNQYQQARVGGTFRDATDVEITNLEIAHTGAVGGGLPGSAGIMAKYEALSASLPAGAIMSNIRIHDNYIHDTGCEGMYLGWTSGGSTRPAVTGMQVYHNQLTNIGWDGIQLNTNVAGGTIHDNTIVGYGVLANTAGDLASPEPYNFQNKGIVESGSAVTIYNNWIQATSQYSGAAANVYVDNVVTLQNNVMICGAFGGTIPDDAIYVNQSTAAIAGAKLDITNNTIIEPDVNGLNFSSTVTFPVTFYNNIIAHPNLGTYIVSATPPGFTQATNLDAPTVASVGFVDPSTNNYDLTSGSSAVDTGTNTASFGVTTDIDGVARPQGSAYDKGAYEFIPTISIGILTPAAWGQASGSLFCPATGAFDAQPTWDAVNLKPVGNDPSMNDTGTAYASRFWYVDFGVDFAKVRITEMWTRYRPFSGGSFSGFATAWWGTTTSDVNSGVPATGLNFATAQGVPSVNSQLWIQDENFTTPVTPPTRYLVFSTGTTITNRPNEFAFIGYRTP